MPRRALMEKRPLLLASLAAAIGYYFERDSAVPGAFLIVWKGAGVAFLALYALLRHREADSRLMAGIMALSAMGDMALEINFEAGAALFLSAHVIAISLYLGHPRVRRKSGDVPVAAGIAFVTPVVAWMLTREPSVAAYAAVLGCMAGSAWLSSFPRARVGTGALLFVASDLLIFAGQGPLDGSLLPGMLIWPLYYFGQFLICTGVVGTLGRRHSGA